MMNPALVLPVPDTALNRMNDGAMIQCGRSHHIHGIDAGGNQGRTIREGTEDGLRKQAQYDEQGDQDGVCQFESHAAGFEQAALFSRSNLVADESSCRGGKSADHHDQQGGNIADDVGNGQRAFPQMFNRQEKNKPDGDGNKRLHHGPSGNGQHSLQQMGAECECPGGSRTSVYPPSCLCR